MVSSAGEGVSVRMCYICLGEIGGRKFSLHSPSNFSTF